MTKGLDGTRIERLCDSLGADRARGEHVGGAADRVFAATAHLHGLTKTVRPLVNQAALLRGVTKLTREQRTAVRRAVKADFPDVPPAQVRAFLADQAAAKTKGKRAGPEAAFALRIAAIVDVAAAVDEAGTHDTEVAGVWDDGRGLQLLLTDGPSALANAASALAATRRWNEIMPRPFDGVRIVAKDEPPRECVDPTHPVGRVAALIRQRELERFLTRLYGVQYPEDVEYVHEMRVALRRVRAALRIFRKALDPSAAEFRARVGQVADVLGAVRDLDVFLDFLRRYGADVPAEQALFVEKLIAHEANERAKRFEAVAEFFGSKEFAEFRGRYCDNGHDVPASAGARAARPVCEEAPRMILKQLERVTALSRPLGLCSARRLHRLRIHCKRLRYIAEFFADVYAGRLAEVREPMKLMQDALGDVHDVDVYTERVGAYASDLADTGTTRADALIGHLVKVRRKALADATSVWGEFTAAAAGGLRKIIQSPRRT